VFINAEHKAIISGPPVGRRLSDPMTFIDMFTAASGNNDPQYRNPFTRSWCAAKKQRPAVRMRLIMRRREC
jgi:hypothetical protein